MAIAMTPGLSDALTILGAAGIVIPSFARLRVNPVIGFILVGIVAGPFALGALAPAHPWLSWLSISDPHGIEPFAEFGIVLLLFSAGLELSFRRLVAMRRAVFGVGAAELLIGGLILAAGFLASGHAVEPSLWLALALAMSSTALVLPIAGTHSAVGRAALAMLLFEDLALVPMLLLIGAEGPALATVIVTGLVAIGGLLLVGRFILPALFAQAARAKKPEMFLAISLLTVILAAVITAGAGLSPILGALVAGLVIAETDYAHEVELVIAPFKGLALGVFLISVGMRIDLMMVWREWPLLVAALAGVIAAKVVVTALLLRVAGAERGVAAEAGLLLASPSETSLILIGAAGAAGVIDAGTVGFWSAATAIGLTLTPLLAGIGRWVARRVERGVARSEAPGPLAGKVVIFGFGRVGRMVADMLVTHGRDYVAIDGDADGQRLAKKARYSVIYGDVSRRDLIGRLGLAEAAAVVLTMDDPVLTARLVRRLRADHPQLTVIARARDTDQAALLYQAGATVAVPETLEASLQLSEAVLVDIGVAMGPVIASIHEKRAELRGQIMAAGKLAEEPSLGRRRVRDSAPQG